VQLIERNLIHLEWIDTSINIADHLTKPLFWILFDQHANFLLGHVHPKYSPVYQHAITTYQDCIEDGIDRFLPDSFTTPMTARADRIFAPSNNDVQGNPWLCVLWHE
jgi:hypothetical protein